MDVRRRFGPVLLLLVAAALLYLALSPRFYLGYTNDDAMYVLAAKALPTGRYVSLNLPHHPPNTHFFPGFPFFLSPFVQNAGTSVPQLKFLPITLICLSILLTWLFAKRWLTSFWALISAGLFALNPSTVDLSGLLMSEPFFLVLLLLVFIFLERAMHKPERFYIGGLVFLLGWAGVVRPEGLFLIISVLTLLLFRRTPGSLPRLLSLSCLPYLGWILRNYTLTGEWTPYAGIWASNASLFTSLPSLTSHAFHALQTLFLSTLGGVPLAAPFLYSGAAGVILLILLGGLFTIGIADVWQRKRTSSLGAAALFCLLFIGAHVLWPVHEPRFFVPILPFLLIFTIIGCQKVVDRIPRLRLLPGLLVIAMLSTYAYADISRFSRHAPTFPAATLHWIRQHTPPDSFILTSKTGLIHLYTGRYTASAVPCQDAKDLYSYLTRSGIGYVALFYAPISDPVRLRLWKNTERWITELHGAYELVYEDREEAVRIVRVIPNAALK